MSGEPPSDRQAIEELLPWLASGRLDAEQGERARAAIQSDPVLQRSLAAVEEDRLATIAANEAIAAPAPRILEKLIARVEAQRPLEPAWRIWLERTANRFAAAFSPTGLALASGLAAAVVIAETATIADLAMRRSPATYSTASRETPESGAFLLVRFVSAANLQAVAALLDANGMRVADGPRADGFWLIRIGPRDMPQDKIKAAESALRARAALVQLVLPGPTR